MHRLSENDWKLPDRLAKHPSPLDNISCYTRTSTQYPYLFELQMLKNQKTFNIGYISKPVSLLAPYNITIQEISNKLKKLFERNVRNVLETLIITNFGNILMIILWNLWENVGATLEIDTEEKIRIDFKGKFQNNFLEWV